MKRIEENLERLMTYISSNISTKGVVPSVREMCAHLGVTSTSTINYYLKTLEERGFIIRSYNKNRSIELSEKAKSSIAPPNMNNVPVVGNVAAGIPIFAEENKVDNFMFSKNLFNADEMFMLVVHGDSMIDIGIMDGDYVIVKRCESAENRQVVVALIDDSATVKTLCKEKDRVYLKAENPLYPPIVSPDMKILGIVIGVVRKY